MKLPSLLRSLVLPVCCFSLNAYSADASKGLLLVTNKGDRSLSFVDPVSNKQIAVLPEEGVTGHEIAASADGKLVYVPIFGDSGVGKPGTDGQLIQVVDVAQKKIVHTIDLGKGLRPHCPVICKKSGLVYVTTENDNSVIIIDPKTNEVVGKVTTGQEQSHMLVVSNDGKRGYTANVGPGTVSVMDLEKKELVTVIPISKTTQRIAISNDDKWVFTADQTQPRLAVINTETNKVEKWIDLPDFGYGMTPTPDGKSLIVCLISGDRVGLLDLEKLEVTKTVQVPRSPQAVIVRPDGKMAYVSCDSSAKVAAINIQDWKVEALIDVGKTADGLTWAAGE